MNYRMGRKTSNEKDFIGDARWKQNHWQINEENNRVKRSLTEKNPSETPNGRNSIELETSIELKKNHRRRHMERIPLEIVRIHIQTKK